MEEAGIPTTSITILSHLTEQLRVPRALAVRFDRGQTVGPPGDRRLQADVVRAALRLLDDAHEGGQVVPFKGT